MNRKLNSVLALALAGSLALLSGCGQATSSSEGASSAASGDTLLNLYTWEGMFPQEVLDAFSKAVSQLKELKGGYSLDDVVDVLMKFGDWLIETSANDKGITQEFIQQLTAYQDQYIKMRINNG